jgi:Tol biopolymer transport system component
MPCRRSSWGALDTLTRGVILLALASLVSSASQAQPIRALTDPRTVVSERNADARPVAIEDLFFTRSALRPAWSPDAREVVFTTNLTGRFNLWKVSAEGGWPIQLTRSEEYQDHPAWSPDGRFIVYDQDHAGDEMDDLYLVLATGGEAQNLTRTDAVAEKEPVWSPDGSRLAFLRKEKSAPNTNLALLDLASRTLRVLTDERAPDCLWERPVWSPDGQMLYATRRNTLDTDSDVYRLEVGSGAQENLTPHQGQLLTVLGAVSHTH